MRFLWHKEALAEYEEAAHYYGQKESGLDELFANCIESAIEGICDAPKMWPVLEEDIRRRVTGDFPYSIVYLELDHTLMIVAVMHNSREPSYWKNRL